MSVWVQKTGIADEQLAIGYAGDVRFMHSLSLRKTGRGRASRVDCCLDSPRPEAAVPSAGFEPLQIAPSENGRGHTTPERHGLPLRNGGAANDWPGQSWLTAANEQTRESSAGRRPSEPRTALPISALLGSL